ncbi:MAG: hypothetical protein HC836_45725 [Richelia sp. RM2_1_2]|nr:hypothetical protein [Richelia sp. RM2_1_2]
MSFGKKRKVTNLKHLEGTYELLRYAAAGSIPGIGSKLLTYFIKHYSPREIISYCDLRWGTGNFYTKLNFTLNKITEPNYWYIKNCEKREHRYKYAKHTLVNQGYDKLKTEWQIMQELGYDRIWDCGSLKFKYTQ